MAESELITNADGSIYHLAILPEDVGDIVYLVGDQYRVPRVSQHFDRIDVRKARREFVTHTGYIGKKRISVISTGIGTDNIDIVMNELDALVNLDLRTGEKLAEHRSLSLIRLGTSGAFQGDIDIGSIVFSRAGLGLDGLRMFYGNEDDTNWRKFLPDDLRASPMLTNAYYAVGSEELISQASSLTTGGITLTCAGFYGPQGRELRLPSMFKPLMPSLRKLMIDGNRITNLEMETAGIYLLANLLGHRAMSINVILANRVNKTFSNNPGKAVDEMIERALEVTAG